MQENLAAGTSEQTVFLCRRRLGIEVNCLEHVKQRKVVVDRQSVLVPETETEGRWTADAWAPVPITETEGRTPRRSYTRGRDPDDLDRERGRDLSDDLLRRFESSLLSLLV